MIAKKNSKKIVKYKKYIGINIGTLLFGIVFVYMMVCIVMYLTSTHIAPYEVKKGSLSGNYKYTALALKSETVVEAPESGAVTYYAREGQKSVKWCDLFYQRKRNNKNRTDIGIITDYRVSIAHRKYGIV